MGREIITSNNKNIDHPKNPEERLAFYKKTISQVTSIFFEPFRMDGVYRQFEEIVELIRNAKNEKEKKSADKRLSELNQKAMSSMLYPWGNLSVFAADKEHQPTLKNMRSSFLEEYCPKTPTELSIIDVIVTAYYNFMRNSRILNFHLMKDDEDDEDQVFISRDPNTMKAAKEASKAVDLAYRQFTNSIILLKEIRQPKLNIHVKTENAYLARNQQVINVKKSNGKKEKIINSK